MFLFILGFEVGFGSVGFIVGIRFFLSVFFVGGVFFVFVKEIVWELWFCLKYFRGVSDRGLRGRVLYCAFSGKRG